jgi:hypothetical protein
MSKLLSNAEEDEGVNYLAWVVGGVNTSLGESIVWKEKIVSVRVSTLTMT